MKPEISLFLKQLQQIVVVFPLTVFPSNIDTDFSVLCFVVVIWSHLWIHVMYMPILLFHRQLLGSNSQVPTWSHNPPPPPPPPPMDKLRCTKPQQIQVPKYYALILGSTMCHSSIYPIEFTITSQEPLHHIYCVILKYMLSSGMLSAFDCILQHHLKTLIALADFCLILIFKIMLNQVFASFLIP